VRLIVGPPQHFAGEEEAVAIAARLERAVEALRADISEERDSVEPERTRGYQSDILPGSTESRTAKHGSD
jgi:hypothetical protein